MPAAPLPPDGWVVQARYPGRKTNPRYFASMFSRPDAAIEAVQVHLERGRVSLRIVGRVSPETLARFDFEVGTVREFQD